MAPEDNPRDEQVDREEYEAWERDNKALVEAETCETCGQPKGQEHLATTARPTEAQLKQWVLFDNQAEATDGCVVEPDGVCEHGHEAWPRSLGIL